MHTLEVETRRCQGFYRHQCIAEPTSFDTRQHGTKAFRTLGMPRARQVFEIGRVGTEQHGHAADATVEER